MKTGTKAADQTLQDPNNINRYNLEDEYYRQRNEINQTNEKS